MSFGSAAGKSRDASGLDQKIVTARGHGKVEAKAPSGYIVVGGGWDFGAMPGSSILGCYPSSGGTGWTVTVYQESGDQPEVTAYAVCLRSS